MSGRYFIDTNIVLYAIVGTDNKSAICQNLLYSNPIISTQVVAESINVMLKKMKYSKEDAFEKASDLLEVCELLYIKKSTMELAFMISLKYQFSFWDSLIVGAALENDCAILYSEDMKHNILVEEKLKILNPFFL